MTEIVFLTDPASLIPPALGPMRARGMRLALRWRIGLDLLSRFCAENMVSLVDMQGGPRSGRHKSIVALRRRFCVIAKRKGIGVIYIGRMLKMDHSTVTYHANAQYRYRKNKGKCHGRKRRSRAIGSGQNQGAGAVDARRYPAGRSRPAISGQSAIRCAHESKSIEVDSAGAILDRADCAGGVPDDLGAAAMSNLSTWNESVSAQAIRRSLPLEHFIGYSLFCSECDARFRCFREFEERCGVCRSRQP